MTHLDEGQLHAYLDGAWQSGQSGQDGQDIERHLAECSTCRSRLEEERRVRDRAGAILAGPGPRSVTPPPFDTVVERAARRQRPRRGARPLVPLAWAASVALAVTAGWYARGMLGRSEPATLAIGEGDARAAPIQAAPPPPRQTAQAEPQARAERQRVETAERPSENVADSTAVAAPSAPLAAPATDVAVAESKGAAPAQAQPAAPAPAPAQAVMARAEAPTVRLRGATGVAAPGGSITGRVVGADNQRPLPGIAVKVEGTARQTVTAADGTFRLADVPPGLRRLQAAGIGYQPQTQNVSVLASETDTVEVAMRPGTVALEEVVVTGTAGKESWLTVSPGEAERRLGGPLATIPGLPSLGTTASGTGASTVTRTVQVLGPGLTIELEQRRADGAISPSAAVQRDARGPVVTVRWEGFSVTGRALVPPDSLRKLLQRLTPAPAAR